jgi:hypothetical protein
MFPTCPWCVSVEIVQNRRQLMDDQDDSLAAVGQGIFSGSSAVSWWLA